MNQQKEIIKNQSIIDGFIKKTLYGLAIIDVVSFFVSTFLMKCITLIIIKILILKFLFKHYNVEERLEKLKWYKKLKFLLTLRKIKLQSKSINQAQVYLTKYLLGMPIEDNEEELKGYTDVVEKLGEKWPYMIKVRGTRDQKITVNGRKMNCISSYAYLDFGRDERVQEAAIKAAREYSTGNHGPRMLCGNLEILEDLEMRIARFFKREGALVFSSGYLACLSVIAGVGRKGDLLLMDKLSHASLKAGAKLSGAKIVYFKHNDFKDAERLVKSNKYNKLFVIIEGVYSMDGDVGFLDQARKLCDKYKGTLIIDEAHSIGAIGKTGRGTEEYYDYNYSADIIVGTFTKSISSVGGFIACSKELKNFYSFYGPGVVFSAPLSAYHAGAADKSFELIEKEPHLVEKLQGNAAYLRNKFREKKFNIGDTVSCVIPVIFRDGLQCINIHKWLLDRNFFTALVMAPACPVNAPRFRITANANMTKEEMDQIVEIFEQAREANKENPELQELLAGL